MLSCFAHSCFFCGFLFPHQTWLSFLFLLELANHAPYHVRLCLPCSRPRSDKKRPLHPHRWRACPFENLCVGSSCTFCIVAEVASPSAPSSRSRDSFLQRRSPPDFVGSRAFAAARLRRQRACNFAIFFTLAACLSRSCAGLLWRRCLARHFIFSELAILWAFHFV